MNKYDAHLVPVFLQWLHQLSAKPHFNRTTEKHNYQKVKKTLMCLFLTYWGFLFLIVFKHFSGLWYTCALCFQTLSFHFSGSLKISLEMNKTPNFQTKWDQQCLRGISSFVWYPEQRPIEIHSPTLLPQHFHWRTDHFDSSGEVYICCAVRWHQVVTQRHLNSASQRSSSVFQGSTNP